MNLVKEYRLRNKMTQQEVAEKLKISLSQVQKTEYGMYPNTLIAINLAKLFNTTVENIFPQNK